MFQFPPLGDKTAWKWQLLEWTGLSLCWYLILGFKFIQQCGQYGHKKRLLFIFWDSTNCVINSFNFLWGIMHVFVLIFFIDNDVVERNVSPFSFWKAECMHRTYWAILSRFVLSAMLVNKQCNAMQCLNTETGYCDAPRSRTVHFGSGSGNRHFGSL